MKYSMIGSRIRSYEAGIAACLRSGHDFLLYVFRCDRRPDFGRIDRAIISDDLAQLRRK